MEKTLGIVLNNVKYGDTSLIVNVYTQAFGRRSYVVKGVRGNRRRGMTALMQPLSIVELDATTTTARGRLGHIREVHVCWPFATIPFDPVRRAISFFMTEVIVASVREEEPNPDLFDFIMRSVQALDEGIPAQHNFHLYFMLQLSRLMGFAPDASNSGLPFFDMVDGVFTTAASRTGHCLAGDDKLLWAALTSVTLDTLGSLSLNADRRQRLIELLEEYYALHLPTFPGLRTHHVLHQVCY